MYTNYLNLKITLAFEYDKFLFYPTHLWCFVSCPTNVAGLFEHFKVC